MKADTGQPRPFQQGFQVIVGGAGTGGLLWSERIWEDPLGVGVFLSLGQQLGGAGRQDDGPLSRTRLGLTGNQPATFLRMDRPADGERSMCLVEVAPHKAADLTLP